MFTDTGSLTYEIKSENVYKEFFKNESEVVKRLKKTVIKKIVIKKIVIIKKGHDN